MLSPAFNMDRVFKRIDDFAEARLSKVEEMFVFVGVTAVNLAKKNATFLDQTGNLRSSIGFVVFRYGKVIKQQVKTANRDDGGAGKKEARELIQQLKSEALAAGGIMLYFFAGMEYAAAVEARGRDVISGSIPAAKALAKELIGEVS